MEEQILIRRAGMTDVDALAAGGASVQELHVAAHPRVFKPVDLRRLAIEFSNLLAEPTARVWIAEIEGNFAGYAVVLDQRRPENAFAYARHSYELEQLAVRPEKQRKGVARAILRHVKDEAAAAGVTEIELNTWNFNEAAKRAFQKLGFSERSVRLNLEVGLQSKGAV